MSEKSALPFPLAVNANQKSEEQRGLSTVKKTSCVKKTGLLQNAGLSGALCTLPEAFGYHSKHHEVSGDH